MDNFYGPLSVCITELTVSMMRPMIPHLNYKIGVRRNLRGLPLCCLSPDYRKFVNMYKFHILKNFYNPNKYVITCVCTLVRATTRSGYVISCNLVGSALNQNIDLTAKGLSSTEMSNGETSKQIAVEYFGWNVP